jgi:hypothetical protein
MITDQVEPLLGMAQWMRVALGGTWPGVEFYSTVAQLVPALIAGFALYAHYTDTPAARRVVYVATFASIAVLFTCLVLRN